MAKVNEIVVWNRTFISDLVGHGNIIAMRFGTEEQVWNGKQCFFFFFREISLSNSDKVILFVFWMFVTFSLLTKAISPLNYISRKKPRWKVA